MPFFPTIRLAIFLAALTSTAFAAEPALLPFAEVRTGMKGTGRTVFSGTRIESFDVEIVGTLPNIGPGQNLILGRCSGGPLGETGILAGMSGSPVFIDDRLVGAVAYAWGFSKEAIAGITPIEEMLAVGRGSAGASVRTGGAARPGDLALLLQPDGLRVFVEERMGAPFAAAGGALRSHSVPVSVSGIGPAGIDRIAPDLARARLAPVQGGGAGADAKPSPALEPGSAVGLKLVRGDVDMTATGTVTWVDGGRVLAFGHPLFGLGALALPMTGATVEALLPSLDRSLRLATPLAEIGTLVEDRNTAIVGRLGEPPRMIPVRLRLSRAGSNERTYSFDVADDPLLAPLLLYSSLNGILASVERMEGSVTLRLLNGSTIETHEHSDLDLNNVFAGDQAPFLATATPAFLLYLLLNNDLARARIDGVNLLMDYDPSPETARLRRVTFDRYRVRAGEEIQATLVLSPFRGSDQFVTRAIRIPRETPAGPLTIQVGNGTLANRADAADVPPAPADLSQLIQLINRVPRNDRVYVVALREDNGVFVDGARLPNLPPSVFTVLSRPRSRGNFSTVAQRSIVEETIPVGRQVDGFARIQVEVESP